MSIQTARKAQGRQRSGWRTAAGWLLVGTAGFYTLYALTEAATTAAALLGLTETQQTRAAPPLFVAHAVTGSVALLAASIQLGILETPPRAKQRRLHRTLGLIYVVAAIFTSLASLPVVAGFDVSDPAKAAFIGEAVLWFATTVTAYVHIRAGRVERHRAWMIRSFALAAFFITFSLWDPVTAALPMPKEASFALAAALGWLVNLAIAEMWIRLS